MNEKVIFAEETRGEIKELSLLVSQRNTHRNLKQNEAILWVECMEEKVLSNKRRK